MPGFTFPAVGRLGLPCPPYRRSIFGIGTMIS